MGCSLRTILNIVMLALLCAYSFFYFIAMCYYQRWLSGWILGFYIMAIAVFTGIAPFPWASCLINKMLYMKLPIWRPVFIILLGFFIFPA